MATNQLQSPVDRLGEIALEPNKKRFPDCINSYLCEEGLINYDANKMVDGQHEYTVTEKGINILKKFHVSEKLGN